MPDDIGGRWERQKCDGISSEWTSARLDFDVSMISAKKYALFPGLHMVSISAVITYLYCMFKIKYESPLLVQMHPIIWFSG